MNKLHVGLTKIKVMTLLLTLYGGDAKIRRAYFNLLVPKYLPHKHPLGTCPWSPAASAPGSSRWAHGLLNCELHRCRGFRYQPHLSFRSAFSIARAFAHCLLLFIQERIVTSGASRGISASFSATSAGTAEPNWVGCKA